MNWRYPGDAGVPPRFDFAGSRNVSDITVLWPAPTRFSEDGTQLIVYKDQVVLPLRILPTDPDSPVKIRLKLEYGICETFYTGGGQIRIVISGKPSFHEPALAAAERRVPRKVAIGKRDLLAILAIRRDYKTTPSRRLWKLPRPKVKTSISLSKGRQLIGPCPFLNKSRSKKVCDGSRST